MSKLKSVDEYDTMNELTMSGFLKLIGVFLLVVLFVGTGQLLSSQVGRSNIWQMFWLGFIIWLWGYIILIRVKDKAKLDEDARYLKNPLLAQHRQELEKVKVAALSALVAITFFYFSISWFFKDDLLLSTVILVITFLVAVQLQNAIIERQKKQED